MDDTGAIGGHGVVVGRVFGELLGRLEVLGEAGMGRDMEYDSGTWRLGVVELERGRG